MLFRIFSQIELAAQCVSGIHL